MKGTGLGALEELILLAAAACTDEAYAVTIKEEIERKSGRSINISSVHTTLHRLEKKGYLTSEMGGTTSERGGRRKRLYSPTHAGLEALRDARTLRDRFWRMIPGLQTGGGS